MEKKNKIIIIICYYGTFPWYFSYFLHSCKYNMTINFLIFSDIPNSYILSSNVSVINISIDEIKQLAIKKLNFQVNIDFAYKFCDFKPAYGFIFSDYIEGYDFWGQSDIDVIFGDIRKFIDDNLLNTYDFISVRHDYTSGCFALYKNSKKMNRFFMRSKDFKLVFTSAKHYCFDECNFAWDELTSGKSIFELETEIESFTHIIKSAQNNNEIKAHFDFILMEGVPGKIRFDHGKIIYKNRYEAILYHLYWLKKIYTPSYSHYDIPECYNISPTRIYF